MNRLSIWLSVFIFALTMPRIGYAGVPDFVGKWKLDRGQSKIPTDLSKVLVQDVWVVRIEGKILIIETDTFKDQYLLDGKTTKYKSSSKNFIGKNENSLTILSDTTLKLKKKRVHTDLNPSGPLAKMGGNIDVSGMKWQSEETWTLRTATILVTTLSTDDRELVYIKE